MYVDEDNFEKVIDKPKSVISNLISMLSESELLDSDKTGVLNLWT